MGFRPSFPDSLPVIDEAPGRRGLFLAFGHGRHTGMTGGAPTARLIKQLVAGEPAARNWLAQTSLAASVGGVNHPVEQGSSVSLSGDGNTAIVRQLQASINLALGSASQHAPHCRGRRRRNSDSLTPTTEASVSSPSQRSSGNSDNVCGRAAPSSKTSIDRRHANSCESLISPRYSTCRCTMRPPATRVFSTTLQ